jgi:hypothetical protein
MKRRATAVRPPSTSGVPVTGHHATDRLPRFDPAAWADDPADVYGAARAYAEHHAPRVGDHYPGPLAWAAYWSVVRDEAREAIRARLRDVYEGFGDATP